MKLNGIYKGYKRVWGFGFRVAGGCGGGGGCGG